jgi:hypothetical protein
MATMVRPTGGAPQSVELATLRGGGTDRNPRTKHLELDEDDDDKPAASGRQRLIQENKVSAAVTQDQKESKRSRAAAAGGGGGAAAATSAPASGSAAAVTVVAAPPSSSAPDVDALLDMNAAIPEPTYAEDFSTARLIAQLGELRDKDNDVLANFVDEFRKEAPDQEIIVGSVDVEDIALQEREYEAQRVKEVQEQARRHQQREIDLLHRERVARATVETERQMLRARHREKEKDLVTQTLTNRERLKVYFRQAEDRLKRAIKSEQGVVHELYGDLVSGERVGRLTWSGRRWRRRRRRWRWRWRRVP